MIYRPSRRLILGGMAAAPILGASPIWGLRPARAQTLDKVSYQTNWRAQAEHGGFYQAIATGIYKKARARRRAAPGRPAGQRQRSCCWPAALDMVDESNAFRTFNFARENVPVLADRGDVPEGPARC